MAFNLFIFELRSHLKGILGWSVGIMAFVGLYVSVYPSVEDIMLKMTDISFYEALGMEFGSFEGYMSSVVLGFLPLILGIYAVLLGTGTLAGEEDAGTLELIMAKPLSRIQIVLVKAAAMTVILWIVLVIGAAAAAGVLEVVKQSMGVSTDVTGGDFFRVLLSAGPVTMAVSMIGLFLGALMPSRRPAAGVTGVVLVAGYFGENLVGFSDRLEPLKPVFLFTYYDSSSKVFSEGVDAGDVLVLLALAVVAFVLALVCFNARNVTTGSWVWKRGKKLD